MASSLSKTKFICIGAMNTRIIPQIADFVNPHLWDCTQNNATWNNYTQQKISFWESSIKSHWESSVLMVT